MAAMEKWPSVYLSDIAIYLNNETPKDIFNRLLNEYKEGKAFRYFDSEWVKEVNFHDIRSNSDKCILKAKCTPSMSINNKYYDVWIVVRKDDEDGHGGGEILSAYCTCTAGICQFKFIMRACLNTELRLLLNLNLYASESRLVSCNGQKPAYAKGCRPSVCPSVSNLQSRLLLKNQQRDIKLHMYVILALTSSSLLKLGR